MFLNSGLKLLLLFFKFENLLSWLKPTILYLLNSNVELYDYIIICVVLVLKVVGVVVFAITCTITCHCAYILFILDFDTWNGKAKGKAAHSFQECNIGKSFFTRCGWSGGPRNAWSFYTRYGLFMQIVYHSYIRYGHVSCEPLYEILWNKWAC